jgi:small subunit ribosomal protein S20
MPRHKSAEKRARQNTKRAALNRAARTRIKGATKALHQGTDPEQVKKSLVECTSLLDRASKNSLIHRRTVNRLKSRLAKHANRIAAGTKQA